MSEAVRVLDKIDFSRAIKNPFAKIAKAAVANGGTLPIDVSKRMMKEAISEVYKSANSSNDQNGLTGSERARV